MFPIKKSTLLGILEDWKNGDFTNAVRDHNSFWTYQNGTVEKATARLATSEEIEYVENNFQ
ncbi:CTP synthase [Oceanobacillus picturae]|uniref:CTP synthase n=1 Tax=Oceanobacillus picturae TaxID=171693 RepID=A0A0U9HHG9_9BACI|nr:CTP synthase [Oceanobacillus picturae]